MHSSRKVAAILLAAGTSSRMGGENKLLLKIAGKTILQWSVENIRASKISEAFVVVGEDFAEIQNCLEGLRVEVVSNKNYSSGLSSSLKTGLQKIDYSTEGVLILLADQPNLQPETINRFLELFNEGRKKIIAGLYDQVTGNPVLFHRDFFDELLQLQGDSGASSLLKRYDEEIATVAIPPEESLDVDTAGDFNKMKVFLENQAG